MKPLVLALVALCTLGAGCSITPTVTRTSAMMTRAEIEEMGLRCKQLRPIDSNIPRTICASDLAWRRYNEITRQATDDLLAEGRKVR